MKLSLVTILFLVASNAMAGGTGIGSLIAPATNVTILLVVAIVFLRKPLSGFFSSKSETISEMLERASSKAKEAEAMMEIQKKKTMNVDSEIKELQEDSEKNLRSFETDYITDINERIKMMKADANNKIETEKKEMLNQLNADLLDLVVAKTKTQIKGNSNLSTEAANNIIKGL